MAFRYFIRRTGYQIVNEEDTAANNVNQASRFWVRHIQCILVFCGLAVAYGLRVNLSVAIVVMTDRNSTNTDETYNWDESIKSYLLSSFFWGYVVTQVPGGYVSQVYGAKYTFLFGVFLCSLLAFVTPLCARLGDWPLVLAVRVLQGLFQGVIFPSTHSFLSKWAPINERGKLVSFCYAGAQFGTFLMLCSSGFLASTALGWHSIFYVSGIFGFVWCILWFLYSTSTPHEHPNITIEERNYIEAGSDSASYYTNQTPLQIPWLKILTSKSFLTLLFVHCANNWGFWTLLTQTPTFMKSILNLDLHSNGPLTSIPYLAMTILSFLFIHLADVLNGSNTMPLWYSRKLFNTIGMWIPTIALIALGYITTQANIPLTITLLTIAVGINAATYLGFQVNHIDLSPNFAGTLMGITNCAANIMSILAPLAVGLIVTDEKNPLQWRLVYYYSAAFYFIGNLLFLFCGRTSPRLWNHSHI